MNFSKRLKLIRIAKDISVEEIAEKLDITNQQIYYMEKRKDEPFLIKFIQALRSTGLDINLILSENAEEDISSTNPAIYNYLLFMKGKGIDLNVLFDEPFKINSNEN